jgi:hypothetical protein
MMAQKTDYITRGEFAHFLLILLVNFLSIVLAYFSAQTRSPQYFDKKKIYLILAIVSRLFYAQF